MCLKVSVILNENFDVQNLNWLKNLELLSLWSSDVNFNFINFENLDLPKLRHLSIRSSKVPKLTKIKLNFLSICMLNQFDFDSFEEQNELRAIEFLFDKNILKQFNKEKFSNLKKLLYLKFNIYGDQLNQKEIGLFKDFLSKQNPWLFVEHNNNYTNLKVILKFIFYIFLFYFICLNRLLIMKT